MTRISHLRWRCSAYSPKVSYSRQHRNTDELPALQQDEGHGPDRHLFDSRREPALRGHHQDVPHNLQERQCLAKVVKEDIADVCQTTSGSRTISLTSPSKWAHSSECCRRRSRSLSAKLRTGDSTSSG